MSALSRARARYLERRTGERLRRYLTIKAALGRFDVRMCAYYGVSAKVNAGCRRAVCRAYAAGLVPTSTTAGRHAPGSFHGRRNRHGEGMAVDFGLRRELVGTAKGLERLRTFQRREHWRRRRGRLPGLVELIGPTNTLIVLARQETNLVEGAPLEQQHDDHVHEAYDG